MCSSLSIHRRSHSAVVSKMTVNYSVMGLGGKCGKWRQPGFFLATQCPDKHVAGRGQKHKHQTTLSVISDSLGTLWATQRSFMQSEKRVHVSTRNCKRLRAQCQSLLFCCVNILNAALEKRSTAFSQFEDIIFNRDSFFAHRQQITGRKEHFKWFIRMNRIYTVKLNVTKVSDPCITPSDVE